ncbi:MAG: hypothetical protein JNM72_10865 [Deltaproteobacteria bacterium]|nr:hypothetical protein [Deltaproteobacteria bacterium]
MPMSPARPLTAPPRSTQTAAFRPLGRAPLGLLCGALLLGLLAPAAAHAAPAAPVAAPSATRGAASALMIGRWQVLGSAEQAETIIMIELTLQAAEPSLAELAAARLSPEAAQQVLDARQRAKAAPNSPELVAMRRLAQDSARFTVTISPDRIESSMGGAVDRLQYAVTAVEGLRVTVAATNGQGKQQTLQFAVPEPTLMMMGPPGAEPLVLRRLPDTPAR